jgi:hypothetical protein
MGCWDDCTLCNRVDATGGCIIVASCRVQNLDARQQHCRDVPTVASHRPIARLKFAFANVLVHQKLKVAPHDCAKATPLIHATRAAQTLIVSDCSVLPAPKSHSLLQSLHSLSASSLDNLSSTIGKTRKKRERETNRKSNRVAMHFIILSPHDAVHKLSTVSVQCLAQGRHQCCMLASRSCRQPHRYRRWLPEWQQ